MSQPPSPATLAGIAAAVLTKTETFLTDAGLELPTSRYVAHGNVSFDCCDVLIVTVLSIGKTKRFPTPDNGVPRPVRTKVPMQVYLLRCATAGDPIPSATQLNDDALALLEDGWVLDQRFGCATVDGSLLTGTGYATDMVAYDGTFPIGPVGGCAGWRVDLTVEPGTV